MIEWDGGLLRSSPKIADLVARYRAYVDSLPKERRHLILHEGHLVYTRPEEREFLTPEIATTAAMVGTPDEIIANIKALEAAGLTHFAFQVTDDPVGQMRAFAETVMRRYA